MKKGFHVSDFFVHYLLVTFSAFMIACSGNETKSNSIPSDSVSIANGEKAFTENCSSCHNFIQDGIGPQLSGLTEKVPAQWITTFISNPKKTIDEGDQRAKMLFEKFHTVMPSFSALGDERLKDIVAYLNTIKVPAGKPDYDTVFLKDPIPEHIAMSDMVLNLQQIAQIPFSSEKQPRTRIAKIDVRPGSNDLYVLDLRGKLYVLINDKPEVYFDISKQRKDFIDQPGLATGFGSFAFHPDFQKNGLLYTSHTEPKGTAKADFGYNDSIPVQLQWVVTEWKTKDPAARTFSGEGREVFRINMVSGIHGMQELTFNPLAKPNSSDYGLLYIGIGDGGCVENGFPSLAHDPSKPWGSVFRIDPAGKNSRNGKYGIPATNPFVRDTTRLAEMYAYGFRNPHRITWSRDGKIIVSNIGQANIESVNILLPGRDYGWPVREGNFLIHPDGNINKAHELPTDDANLKVTYPAAQYDHDEGKAISGGYEYHGNIKELKGKYIFGDINNGRLFYVDAKALKPGAFAKISEFHAALNGTPTTMMKLCGSERVDLRLGIDGKGEMYVFTKPDGKIYKIASVTKNSN